jgi:hypothetical protein
MAKAFRGRTEGRFAFYRAAFLKEIIKWQNKTASHLEGNIGYVEGAINHLWHGSKKQRGFEKRRRILNSAQFTYQPNKHIYYDTDGLLHFRPHVRKYYLNRTRNYFLSRNEDA